MSLKNPFNIAWTLNNAPLTRKYGPDVQPRKLFIFIILVIFFGARYTAHGKARI
jgi:hypothetical protein